MLPGRQNSNVDGRAITRKTGSSLPSILAKTKSDESYFDAIYGRVSKPRSRKQMIAATKLKAGDGQQAQNELDHLAKYGLIKQNQEWGNAHHGDEDGRALCIKKMKTFLLTVRKS